MGTQPQRKANVPQVTYLYPLALLASGCLVVGCQEKAERSVYEPRVVAAVSSTELADTQIVPTLDTPLSKSGNAVWCATFQVAWNRARQDVIDGPLRIANAQLVTDRLNNSPVTEAALPPGSFLAVAGRIDDGIIQTIRRDMRRQFPGVTLPNFDGAVGFVTYAHLETKATFTSPFVDTEFPIQFSDAAGVAHSVRGFGLHQGSDWDLRVKQAAQVKVLFSQTDDASDPSKLTAFALDLTADQAQQQLIVAVLPRPPQLRAAMDDLAKKIEEITPDDYSSQLHSTDTLAIPNITFHLNHEFAELQGVDKVIENTGAFQGLSIRKAWQSIRFRLDKSGATLISEAMADPLAMPRQFVVDRPFLIVMKRRSSDEPFFVAWIDNAELLELTGGEAGSSE